MTATAASCSQINLSWNASTDSGGSGLKGYNVYRNGNFLKQVLAPSTSTSDTGLNSSSSYTYTVAAVDNATNISAQSSSYTAATPACADGTPPTVPTGLTASASSCDTIVLSWTASTDSGGSGLAGYRIYRSGVQIGTTASTTYSDSGRTASTTYSYTVAAYDNATNVSAQSSSASATTTSCTTTPGLFSWSRGVGGTATADSAHITSMTTDGSGNVIIAGYFEFSCNFGGGVMTSSGSARDIFVAKYSPTGAFLWSKQFGASSDDVANGVGVDANGNVYVAGYFYSTVDFGGGALTSAGNADIFLLKLNSSGTHQWSKRFGGSGTDRATGLAVDGSGNAVMTGDFGYFGNAVDFGGGPLTSAGGSDMFVAKYSSAGAHLWSSRHGGTSSDYPQSVALDGSGNVVVTGYFNGSASFGGGTLTSAGSSDVFVSKYNSSGAHQWSQRYGDSASQWAYSVAADSSGNILVCGSFYGTLDFGGGSVVNLEGADSFVVKLSPSGAHVWSRSSNTVSPLGDVAYGVAVDGNGNVVMTGTLVSAADFGGGALLNTAGTGTYDIYVVKYNANGAHQWSRRYGGGGDDRGVCAKTDASGNVYFGGWFMESVNFGGATHLSPGGTDSFIVKFGP